MACKECYKLAEKLLCYWKGIVDLVTLTEAMEPFNTCPVGPLGGQCYTMLAVELNRLVQVSESLLRSTSRLMSYCRMGVG